MPLEPRFLLAPPLALPLAVGLLVVEPCHGGRCVNPYDLSLCHLPVRQAAPTPWDEPAAPATRGSDAA
ncbi:MAG TPA: hypothetical protein VF406_14010 [Thermodesulfobacteriota bacterium]